MSEAFDRLTIAQHEGLAPNARRFFRFLGHVPELQVLGMPDKFQPNIFAHSRDAEQACSLLAEVEAKKPAGVYVVMNVVDAAVRSRAPLGRWHPQKKGEATSDADVTHRAALYIDIDWARPKGTSTTDEECETAIDAAGRIVDRLRQSVPESSIGIGHSGNCAAVFIALDMLEEREARSLVREVVLIADLLFTDPHIRKDRNARNGIDVDTSVTDAKRLVPAFGTTKRKGAEGNQDRPHRRTAFVCAHEVSRLSLAELEDLVVDLRADLDSVSLDELDRAMGRRKFEIKKPLGAYANGDDAFARAKEVPIGEVLAWCNLGAVEAPICCGCGLSDSGVAVVKNGLKCSHDRCSQKGHALGFRTTVDVVCESMGLSPRDAVEMMAGRWGFPFNQPKAQAPAPQAPQAPKPQEQPKPEESKQRDFREAEHISHPAIRVVQKYLTEGQKPEFISTGFPDLDELMSLEPQSLVVLGARSGRGKSTLSMQMAMSVAEDAGPTLYFSSEMSSEQLALRAMCSIAKVDSKRVRRATVTGDEMGRLTDAGNRVRQCMAWITDEPGLDVLRVKHIARKEVARIQDKTGKPVRLVVVDYLQRIKAGKAAAGGANREQQVNAIAVELKELARELNLCVMVPAQLNAEGDQRGDDARPRASEMRESKGIENESDVILLIHNPNYIRRVEDPAYDWSKPEMCEIILGKGRSDGNGKADMWFLPQFTRFESVSEEWKQKQRERAEVARREAESKQREDGAIVRKFSGRR